MAKKEFTATEVMMLQEELGKGIKVIGEQLFDIKHDVKELKHNVGILKEDMAIVKTSLGIKVNRSEFEVLGNRVTVLEAKPA